jgi:hypothetical protein
VAPPAVGGDPPPRPPLGPPVPESDWLRNLRAGGGRLVRMGRTYELSDPRVLPTAGAAELERLSPPARAYCRLADHQVLATIGPRLPGFGPGRGR